MTAVGSSAPPSLRLWDAVRKGTSRSLPERDRWAISDLTQVYALAVDDCDATTAVDTFTPDGAFVRAGQRVQGAGELTAFFERMMSAYWTTLHTPTSLVVVPDGDGAARGVATGSAELVMPDGTLLLASYRYADQYRRQEDVWRFSSRRLTFRYVLPATEIAHGMRDLSRIRRPDAAPAPADLPESYSTWRAAHPDA